MTHHRKQKPRTGRGYPAPRNNRTPPHRRPVNITLPAVPEVGRCYSCREVLPAASFAVDRSKPQGRKSICKACDRKKSKAYYRDNREQRLAKAEARRREWNGG